MNTKTTATTFLILILVGYILYLTQCNRPKPCPPNVQTKVIIRKDTTTVPRTDTMYLPGDTIYQPKSVKVKGKDSIIYVSFTVVKEVPAKIDTQAIIQSYYSERIQRDGTMVKRGDNLIQVNTVDTVSQNRIIGRRWSIELIENGSTVQKQKAQFYFGGGGYTSLFLNKGLSTETISGGHIDFGYINKRGEHLKVDLMRSGGRWHEGLSFYHTFR